MTRQQRRSAARRKPALPSLPPGYNRHQRRVIAARRFRPDGFGIHLAPRRLALLKRLIRRATAEAAAS